MAPAIAHFLVGATFCLCFAVPIVLRYDLDREHAIWLIPLGGLWGLAPDIHHILPVFSDAVYAIHNTPWVEVFGLHYTLDRAAIRAHYNVSVFGSIAVFGVAIASFWSAGRVRRARVITRGPFEGVVVASFATLTAAGLATVGLWVAVSVQAAFPTVAGLLGRSGVLVGGLVVLGSGLAMGVVWAPSLELVLRDSVGDPSAAAAFGGLIGGFVWVGGVVVAVPVVVGQPIPFVHLGAFAALVVYGLLFGAVYGIVRGAFRSPEPV